MMELKKKKKMATQSQIAEVVAKLLTYNYFEPEDMGSRTTEE